MEMFLDRYTLVIGEVGRGKTRLTADFIKELIRLGYDDKLYIIDLAPNTKNVGARLSKYVYGFRNSIYRYSREIKAPRLEATDANVLREYTERNYRIALEFFNDFIKSNREILVVNDLSIFLHSGSVEELMDIVYHAKTFFGNSYYGESIVDYFGSGLDRSEKRKVIELSSYMDNVIKL